MKQKAAGAQKSVKQAIEDIRRDTASALRFPHKPHL